MATRRTIVLACGGTAGHVYPALALAAAYRESHPDAKLLFIGTPAGIESKLVPADGYPLELIPRRAVRPRAASRQGAGDRQSRRRDDRGATAAEKIRRRAGGRLRR